MKPIDSDAQWEQIGSKYPYFGVFAHEAYKKLDESGLDTFFQTGEAHIDVVSAIIHDHIDAGFNPVRCLDFGCGVGRIAIPLARRFPEVVGLDISPSMLAEAGENCRRYGVDNLLLLPSDDRLSQVSGSFDFIHSYIVFQHIDPERGLLLLARLIDLLAAGGVAVLHFTYAYERPLTPSEQAKRWVEENIPMAHNVANFLRGEEFGAPYMMMHHYDLNRLFALLQDKQCGQVVSRFSNHNHHLGLMLFTQKTQAPLM